MKISRLCKYNSQFPQKSTEQLLIHITCTFIMICRVYIKAAAWYNIQNSNKEGDTNEDPVLYS